MTNLQRFWYLLRKITLYLALFVPKNNEKFDHKQMTDTRTVKKITVLEAFDARLKYFIGFFCLTMRQQT